MHGITPTSARKLSANIVHVPKATWAVFVNEPHNIEDTSKEVQNLSSRIYTDWLPTANYEIEEGYEFEMYYSDANGKFYENIWCRVIPKYLSHYSKVKGNTKNINSNHSS